MSGSLSARWLALVAISVLVASMSAYSLSVNAAPQDRSLFGITPTPTFTPEATPTGEPDVRIANPVITKRGEPRSAFPGEEVVFTLEVTNHGQLAAVDVVVTDEVPSYLEIIEVTTTQGTVHVEGQRIVAEIGVVGPSFVVKIVIRTRVSPDAPSPLDMENVAELSSPNGGNRISSPVTISVPATVLLPATGMSDRISAAIIPVFFASLLVAVTLWRRKRT